MATDLPDTCLRCAPTFYADHEDYVNGEQGFCPGGTKRSGHVFDHSALSSAEPKNEWSHTSTPGKMLGQNIDVYLFSSSIQHCLQKGKMK